MKKIAALIFLLILSQFLPAQAIREYMDLQIHPTMHVPYRFFGKGLRTFDPEHPPKLKHKHLFKDVNYTNYLADNRGARILVNGALTTEFIHSKRRARKMIMKQIDYINRFVAANSDDFAVAKSPQEVRDLVQNTDKTIFIHSIEGGKRLVNSAEDAQFWADQGVAFITLIHLVDDLNGGAAILPDLNTKLINLRGVLRREKNRRLTEHGKNAIQWLANAGVMTDITHMSDLTRKDAIEFMTAHQIPVISTHDGFKPIQNHPRGMEAEDILSIYEGNGFISLPISGLSLGNHHTEKEFIAAQDSLPCFCDGSIDSYKFTYEVVQDLIEGNVARISNNPDLYFEALSEEEKERYAIGFQTDFNGWCNHHRPRFGKSGCSDSIPGQTYEAIETEGLRHPGLMSSHWALLEKEGVDITPIKRASERFLQVWEYFLETKGQH